MLTWLNIVTKRHGYTPLLAGMVTIVLLGSPNITPCNIEATGTINVTLNCKSISLNASGYNAIGTRPISTPRVKSTSLGLSQYSWHPPEN